MPIVIARTGELNPQYTPLTPEQRERMWAYIIKNWTNANAPTFREMLEAEEREAAAAN